MINADIFEQGLLRQFGFTPTYAQGKLFHAFTRFLFSEKPRCALIIKGYAGTGKTSCVSAMVGMLAAECIDFRLLAPTGRAARVLGSYSNRNAWTIHRQIYNRKSDRTGRGWFELRDNELTNAIFFVDEASMIGSSTTGNGEYGDLLEDLITHVYSGEGCKLVLIGDSAQLPPVGSDKSPALELDKLRYSFSLNVAELELTEVIRQQQGSGILENATRIRELITSGKSELPQITTAGFDDVVRVDQDLQTYFEDAWARYGKEDMIIITRSNKRANLFNQQVRSRILWYEEEIGAGDRMMVLKNNYFWLQSMEGSAGFIANGDVLQIIRILKFEDRGAFRFCTASVRLTDYPEQPDFEAILLCNAIWEESASLPQEKLHELANMIALDYPDITQPSMLRKKVYSDPYYNALQVKFAYAVTCHKAQGGQWPCVFVDQGYVTDEMAGIELNRWFYTAFTRAQEKLFLVGFEEKLYAEKNE